MIRETTSPNKIAILATGDEISNGDVLNTNGQEIAHRLLRHGMHIGNHVATPDAVTEIEQAILFLLTTHRALIITGGLGPTSDDLTRFALSKAINRPLIFDEPTWENIVTRLKRLGYDAPPLSNRQQALFPEHATIIPNANGTAAGCMIEHEQKLIFMLPGPPSECLPMLEQMTLPSLQQAGFSQIKYYKSWLLFSVSEGQIAEELDAIVKPYACITGYRLCYPYIEFKIYSDDKTAFATAVALIEKKIQPYIFKDGQRTVSDVLRSYLEKHSTPLTICDLATGGLLESIIKTPLTYAQLQFTYEKKTAPHITIEGLNEFWHNQNNTQTEIKISFANQQESICANIPYRGHRVKQYAVEFICWKICDVLLGAIDAS